MVLAVAALLFQLSPIAFTPAQPASAPEAASSDAPVLLAANVPDAHADIAKLASASSTEPNHPVAPGGEAIRTPANRASLEAALQNSQSLSLIRVVDSKPARFISLETSPSRNRWIALSVLQHAAATFDAYTTRDAISHGAVEQDPLMRPFANSSAIYAAIQVCPVVLDFAARKMQRSQNDLIRRAWWLPQSVSTGMYIVSGVHNIHVANQR